METLSQRSRLADGTAVSDDGESAGSFGTKPVVYTSSLDSAAVF